MEGWSDSLHAAAARSRTESGQVGRHRHDFLLSYHCSPGQFLVVSQASFGRLLKYAVSTKQIQIVRTLPDFVSQVDKDNDRFEHSLFKLPLLISSPGAMQTCCR